VQKFGIPHQRIFASRATAAHAGVMKATNGVGVDVVLNSDAASGELLQPSWKCTAEFGTFIDITRGVDGRQGLLDMQRFQPNRTFGRFDIARLIERQPQRIMR
jgi:NADPH:quinone reductase-like Zn-dependent oxidoreductase